MKAAVIFPDGELPQYLDFLEPTVQSDHEKLVSVKAVAIKHFDRTRAKSQHYSSDYPRKDGYIAGSDGVCFLPDGTRVYAIGVSGMLAEKATIDKERMVKLPERLNDATAAALANAVMGAAMGLKFKAKIQSGDVVLINGATGFTGRVAIQIAKYYGARKVIVTGRNQQSLQELSALGADEIISLLEGDAQFVRSLKKLCTSSPIDVIIDYLWGHTAEMILSSLKGNGSLTNKTRFVSVGSVTGDLIQLSAANLRSVDLQITGSGLGSWSKDQIDALFSKILPEMFQLAASGKLKAETIEVKLKDIAQLWDIIVPNGRRLVIII
jgi:NADPH:quinone reductase-like Zn-dependent oxidoreductase